MSLAPNGAPKVCQSTKPKAVEQKKHFQFQKTFHKKTGPLATYQRFLGGSRAIAGSTPQRLLWSEPRISPTFPQHMVSTGRGGAGNIVSEKEPEIHQITSNHKHHNDQRHEDREGRSHDKQYYVSTGRGGAGNIKRSSSIPLPKLVPQGSNTPAITQNKFTTGRGGYGNMVENEDPEFTRKLQDVDGKKKENDLQAVSSAKSFSVGRGGFGNVVSAEHSGELNNSNNLYTVVSQGSRHQEKKKGFVEKVKGFFGS